MSTVLHPFIFTILLLLPQPLFSSKPGCPDRCGTLPISYPFGVGPGCSAGESFDLRCDGSTSPPKPYLTYFVSPVELIEIKPSQIRVRQPGPYTVTGFCYEKSGQSTPDYVSLDLVTLSGTQYTLSEENWLTSIGCDDLVVGTGVDKQPYGGGCVSYCRDRFGSGGGGGSCPDNNNGYSAGTGCCRAPVPKGLTYLGVKLADVSRRLERDQRMFPCTYAFVQEKGNGNESEFSYPLSYLNTTEDFRQLKDFELVSRLDWRFGAQNCSQARRNSTAFGCRENTVCRDFFDAELGGYLCECTPGYRGNPYLTGDRGCKDINECQDRGLNPCSTKNANCNNIEGSATCSCQEGYFGDGRKDGLGCNPHPKVLINILIGLGSGFGFVLLFAMCFWLHKILQKRKIRKRKEIFRKRNGSLLLQQQTNVGKTKQFSAEELETATDRFSETRILGRGGQGVVYKGMLSDGKIVAIKKTKAVDQNFLEHFINEVAILSQINHRNVVKLLGCCLETEVPLLVYEFLSNGTLFDLIHDPSTKCLVSWNMRLKIAADIAGALAYIHSASAVPIFHRDIKSKNFLLDEKYVVKLADFGMSRSVEVNQTHLTTMVKGTFGYFDPEYFQSHQYSEKSEVYSFGVVLAELLTGKRPVFWETEEEKEKGSLAAFFLESMEENRLDEILDPQVREHGREEEVMAAARVAERCLNLRRKMRPSMKEVGVELERLRMCQMPATVDECEEEEVSDDANPTVISNTQYMWETSCINVEIL